MGKIVFDVDNVLADTTYCWCKKASEYLGETISKEDIKNDKIVGSVTMERSVIYKLQDEVWQEWQKLPTTEDGIPKIIFDLKNKGFQIIIATCRPSRSAPLVVKWLNKTGILYDAFYSLGPYKSKANLDCDVLVDDAPNQVLQAVENGKIGILYTQPWNRNTRSLRVIRINSLAEVSKWINSLEATTHEKTLR